VTRILLVLVIVTVIIATMFMVWLSWRATAGVYLVRLIDVKLKYHYTDFHEK